MRRSLCCTSLTVIISILPTLVLLSSVAFADRQQDEQACKNQLGEDSGIAACTVLIKDMPDCATTQLKYMCNKKLGELFVQRGVAYLKRGKLKEAIQDGSEAIRVTPASSDAYQLRARAYAASFDLYLAKQDYAKAVEIDPDDPFVRIGRAAVFYMSGNYDDEISDLTFALGKKLDDKTRAMVLDARVKMLSLKGQSEAALKDSNEALALVPDSIPFLYQRGVIHYRIRNYDQAITDFNEALRRNPKFFAARIQRGWAYDSKEQKELAKQDHSDVIKQIEGEVLTKAPDYKDLDPAFPRDVDSFALAGDLLFQKGYYASADESYYLAERIGLPYHLRVGVFARMGYANFLCFEYKEAAEYLSKAVKLDPKDPYPVLWLHLSRLRGGQDAATELEKNAAALDATKWPAAVVDLYRGKLDANKVLAAAKNADPQIERQQLCEAYFYLGEYEYLHGDGKDAVTYYKQSVATGQTDFLEYAASDWNVKTAGNDKFKEELEQMKQKKMTRD